MTERQQRVCTKCNSIFDPMKSSSVARDRLRVCQTCRSAAQAVNKARYDAKVRQRATSLGIQAKALGRGPTWNDRALGEALATHLGHAWGLPSRVTATDRESA